MMFESWNPETMTDEQRQRFDVEEVGESSYSCRTTFKVTCKKCQKVIHEATNHPPAWMEMAEGCCDQND